MLGRRGLVWVRWTQELKVDRVYVVDAGPAVATELPFDERLDRVWDGEIK